MLDEFGQVHVVLAQAVVVDARDLSGASEVRLDEVVVTVEQLERRTGQFLNPLWFVLEKRQEEASTLLGP